MKNVLMTLLALCFSVTASAATDLTPNAKSYDGQYAFDLVNFPEIKAIIDSTPAAASKMDAYTVASPATVTNGRFLTFSACLQHSCPSEGYVAVIDLKTQSMYIAFSTNSFFIDKTIVAQEVNNAWLETNLSLLKLPINIVSQLQEFERRINQYSDL